MPVGLIRFDPPAAAHPQMKDHGLPAVEVDEAVFGAATQAGNGGSGHGLDQIGGEGATQVRAIHADPRDSFAIKITGKAADRGFDFGKFRHRRNGCAENAPPLR